MKYEVGMIFYDAFYHDYYKIFKITKDRKDNQILHYHKIYIIKYNPILEADCPIKYVIGDLHSASIQISHPNCEFYRYELISKLPTINGKEFNWDVGCWEEIK
jgi:hypothetical protein